MKFKFERILQVLIKYVYKLFYSPKLNFYCWFAERLQQAIYL